MIYHHDVAWICNKYAVQGQTMACVSTDVVITPSAGSKQGPCHLSILYFVCKTCCPSELCLVSVFDTACCTRQILQWQHCTTYTNAKGWQHFLAGPLPDMTPLEALTNLLFALPSMAYEYNPINGRSHSYFRSLAHHTCCLVIEP